MNLDNLKFADYPFNHWEFSNSLDELTLNEISDTVIPEGDRAYDGTRAADYSGKGKDGKLRLFKKNCRNKQNRKDQFGRKDQFILLKNLYLKDQLTKNLYPAIPLISVSITRMNLTYLVLGIHAKIYLILGNCLN